ncbi:MAG TPA: MOSC domain-containing protein [Candidatus Acidoferrum sp.]|nr:MOSC domain-containing protein [Candidatus Acidoferrum sp.]
MGKVERVFMCEIHRFPMKELQEAEAVDDKGIRGCIHGRKGSKRQVLLIDAETLEKFGLAPGATKENITTRGLDFQALAPGQKLRVGESLMEITFACDPCSRMDEIRMGLQEELRGQRGWLCRVVSGGKIRRGDAIEVVETAAVAKQS